MFVLPEIRLKQRFFALWPLQKSKNVVRVNNSICLNRVRLNRSPLYLDFCTATSTKAGHALKGAMKSNITLFKVKELALNNSFDYIPDMKDVLLTEE